MNLNHLTLSGNLTANPEQKFTPQGKAVCNLRLAHNTKTAQGQETLFIDATCWEKTAEVAAQYLTKGSPVILEGRLKQEEWADKQTGAKRTKLTMTVTRLHLVPQGKPKDLAEGAPTGAGADDDIPFDGAPPAGQGGNPFAQG